MTERRKAWNLFEHFCSRLEANYAQLGVDIYKATHTSGNTIANLLFDMFKKETTNSKEWRGFPNNKSIRKEKGIPQTTTVPKDNEDIKALFNGFFEEFDEQIIRIIDEAVIKPQSDHISPKSNDEQESHKKRKRDLLKSNKPMKEEKEKTKRKKKSKAKEPISPQNEGKNTGKKAFVEGLQMAVSLDILARFYDTSEKSFGKPSQSKLDRIIKDNNISDIHNIDNMEFPSHFSVHGKRLSRIIQYTLYGFDIIMNKSQTNPLFEKKSGVIANIENLLHSYVKTCNITELMKGLEREGLTFNKNYTTFLQSKGQVDQSKLSSEEITTLTLQSIHGVMLSAIIPPFRDSNTNSEMELTRNYFAPIMSFTTLFDGCTGGSNCSIKDYLRVGSLESHLQSRIPDFRPDDYTIVSYRNSFKCIRIIREDSPETYHKHTSHKDFISLISQMKLALSHSIRELIKGDIESWHKEIIVMGITTDRTESHLYSIHCSPKSKQEEIILSNYELTFIGSYKHNVISDRIQLVSRIITSLIYPKEEDVNNYLATQTRSSDVRSAQKDVAFPNYFLGKPISYEKNYTVRNCRSIIKKCSIDGTKYFVKYLPNNSKEDMHIYEFLTLYTKKSNNFSFTLAGTCMSDIFVSGSFPNIMDVFIDFMVQLKYFARSSLTHNDIKPENVVLFDERWFFIDFEIATNYVVVENTYVDDYGQPLKTESFSRGYRSPERVSGNLISPESDIYSCGLILLELLYRERLSSMEDNTLVQKYLKKARPKNKEEEIILSILPHMLNSDPTQRLDAEDLLQLATSKNLNEQALKVDSYFMDKYRFKRTYFNFFSKVSKQLNFD